MKSMYGWKKGFTIIELVIVVAVIAILATVVMLSYNGIRNRSRDTAILKDLRNLAGKIQTYEADYNSAPTTATNLDALNWQATQGSYRADSTVAARNLIYCYSGTGSANNQYWAVLALSKSGKIFYITQDGEETEYTATTKPSFTSTEVAACGTLTSQVTGQAYAAGLSGWYSADTTTGPWRAWTVIN